MRRWLRRRAVDELLVAVDALDGAAAELRVIDEVAGAHVDRLRTTLGGALSSTGDVDRGADRRRRRLVLAIAGGAGGDDVLPGRARGRLERGRRLRLLDGQIVEGVDDEVAVDDARGD